MKPPGSPETNFVVLSLFFGLVFWGEEELSVLLCFGFFFFIIFISKITCFGSYSFLWFVHVPPLWLFWQWCSGKEWMLEPLLRADTAGRVRFLCRWLSVSWQRWSSGWGTGDSASRSADVLPSRVADVKNCNYRSDELCWAGRIYGQAFAHHCPNGWSKWLLPAQNTNSLLSFLHSRDGWSLPASTEGAVGSKFPAGLSQMLLLFLFQGISLPQGCAWVLCGGLEKAQMSSTLHRGKFKIEGCSEPQKHTGYLG